MEQKVEEYLLPEDEVVTLPSGLVVTLRAPDNLTFLAAGILPTYLAGLVVERQQKNMTQAEAIQEVLQDKQAVSDLEQWAIHLITLVVVEPKFSLTPAEGEYDVRRLRSADRAYIIEWSNKFEITGGGRADLETFREAESGTNDSAGESVPTVGQGPVGLSEPEGP